MTGHDKATRSDARRNRRRLLDAATHLILEIGGEPSRDAVAQRAGVGIATLYRHFPTQQELLRNVAVDVLHQTIAAGVAALDEERAADGVLRRYLHAAIDIGLGAVNIVHPLLDDTDWPEQAVAARVMLDRIIDTARRNNEIADTITTTDVTHAAIRFSRPLGISIDPIDERAIAHRQLDHHLNGWAQASAP